jgi:hypothetical protein
MQNLELSPAIETQPLSEVEQKTQNALTELNLNWSVRKEPLFTANGIQSGSTGIFRNDNDAWLGTVSSKYTPYQNEDMVRTIIEASSYLGLEAVNGGCLNGGKRVFIQLELPEAKVGKSDVKRYITALNSHNGLNSVAFGSSNTVMACQNKFLKVYQEVPKFRHHSNTVEQIKQAVTDIQKTAMQDIKLMQAFQLMESVGIADEMREKVYLHCFGLDLNDIGSIEKNTRKNKVLTLVNEALEVEKSLAGDSAWGLFNAVTRYTNHDKALRANTSREDYLMNGQGYTTNNIAFNIITEWIESNTKQSVNFSQN